MSNKLNFFQILFFALYMILPSYFAIELSSSFPLMTGNRILLILLIIWYCISKRGVINLKIFEDKKMKKSVILYFILMLLTNMYYVFTLTDALKEILILILEEFLLIWIIVKMIDTKEKLDKALNIIVTSSGVVAVIAIIGSITGINLFYYLNTVSREMLMASYSRLGFTRAEAGFGHPVYYGAYCVCMIPIIMYLIEHKGKKLKYMICLGLNILALIFANSRGSLIIFLLLIIYMIIEKKPKDILKYFPLIFCAIVILCIISMFSSTFFNFFSDITKSIINVFSASEEKIENYGTNSAGLESRVTQFTQVSYAMEKNSLFGLGVAAQNRGVLKWYNPYVQEWKVIKTFDVGYFAIICQYGILGAIGYFSLYSCIIKKTFSKKSRNDEYIQMFKYIFVAYFLMLLSIAGVNNTFWVLFGLLLSYINIKINEDKEDRMGGI